MSEPEFTPRKVSRTELADLLKGISKVADSEKPQEPDPLALEGEDDLIQAGQAWLREEIRQTQHLHFARMILLGGLFVLVLGWLFSVILLLIMVGFSSLDSFNLSDKVIITYITSTTVSVLGLFHIAAKWLFSAQSFFSRAKERSSRAGRDAP